MAATYKKDNKNKRKNNYVENEDNQNYDDILERKKAISKTYMKENPRKAE